MLQIWRFHEEAGGKFDAVKNSPVNLASLSKSNFVFQEKEAYLILLIYKADSPEQLDVHTFPKGVWSVVQTTDNLSPRGLASTFASNEDSSVLL